MVLPRPDTATGDRSQNEYHGEKAKRTSPLSSLVAATTSRVARGCKHRIRGSQRDKDTEISVEDQARAVASLALGTVSPPPPLPTVSLPRLDVGRQSCCKNASFIT